MVQQSPHKNIVDAHYLNLLKRIQETGTRKGDRTGTGTVSIFGPNMSFDIGNRFPILTSKEVHFPSVASELIWFMQGRTDLRSLLQQKNYIWVGDAYKNYLYKVIRDKDIVRYLKSYSIDTKGVPTIEPYSKDEFIERIKNDDNFAEKWGELGPIYGKQWRDLEVRVKIALNMKDPQTGETLYTIGTKRKDQLVEALETLMTNPDSRRIIVNAWNPGELDQMTLPPCHTFFQFYTKKLPNSNKRALSLKWYQRSVDTPLGLPFNISSYGLLLHIVAKMVNMVPDQLHVSMGDTHIYNNQLEHVPTQLQNETFELPTLEFHEDFLHNIEYLHKPKLTNKFNNTGNPNFSVFLDYLNPKHFTLKDYKNSGKIPYPLSN